VAGDKSPPTPRVSRADVVYEQLREEIIHGEVTEETQLNQVELAERFGVSRIPIREALNRLQAESLIVATPYHPFVVRNVTPDQVAELVEIRAALEDLGCLDGRRGAALKIERFALAGSDGERGGDAAADDERHREQEEQKDS